jgi:hypothetical protein
VSTSLLLKLAPGALLSDFTEVEGEGWVRT